MYEKDLDEKGLKMKTDVTIMFARIENAKLLSVARYFNFFNELNVFSFAPSGNENVSRKDIKFY